MRIPWSIQKRTTLFSSFQSFPPGVGFKVDGKDVLVFFSADFSAYWIVPSGRLRKPFGVLLDVWMVRGALVGQIHGYFHAVAPGFDNQAFQIIKGAEGGMNGPCGRLPRKPMAQGEPTSSGWALVVLFFALAIAHADGMDRGQVKNVKAHFRYFRQVFCGNSPRLPCSSCAATQERGKSSYQVLKRARSLSTHTANSW